jgi:hypothetical protein
MAEYAVVLGVITLAIVTTFATMAGSIQSVLEGIVGVFSGPLPRDRARLSGPIPADYRDET